jgi:hypothetical protein
VTIIRALARAIPGAVFGALFGVLLLVFAAVATTVVLGIRLIRGIPIPVDDVGLRQLPVFLLVYCASFSAGGAAVAALWPLHRSRSGAYLLGYVGAGIVSAILGGLIMWQTQDYDLQKHLVVWGIMTVTFGTAGGYQIRHWETPQQTWDRLRWRRPD